MNQVTGDPRFTTLITPYMQNTKTLYIRHISTIGGAAWHRSRLNSAKRIDSLDINVQFPGAETIDSRQYRQTRVSEMIHLASVANSPIN